MAKVTAPAECTDKNCMFCQDDDCVDNMVQCDSCDLWAHFRCANVTDDVKNEDWICSKCNNSLPVPKTGKRVPAKKGVIKRSAAKSDAGSDVSVGASQISNSEAFQLLEQEREAREQEMEDQRKIVEKRLNMESALMEKKRIQHRELLEKEKSLLKQRLEDERLFLETQRSLRNQFQKLRVEMLRQYETSEDEAAEDVAKVAAEEGINAGDLQDKVRRWLDSDGNDMRGARPKTRMSQSGASNKKQQGDPKVKNVLKRVAKGNRCESVEDDEEEHDDEAQPLPDVWTEEELAAIREILKRRKQNRSGSPQEPLIPVRGPTQDQLAARQASSKHLPTFRGEPEVWPLFISCYEYTTAACGYTNTDNLKRLQDSLQGLAKEAVQSRLLLPDSVPEVIADLRKLFGNPEKLLKTLVAKVRKAQAPRLDKLETFLYFGITVKQLCDHLEAAGLQDHLCNPMLVQELVSKLPSEYKLDWVRFKRGKVGTPLRIFTDFTNEIVSEVSEVTDFIGAESSTELTRSKPKKKEYVHTHDAQSLRSTGRPSQSQHKPRSPCVVCKRTDHKVRFCDDFAKLGLQNRMKIVEKYNLCITCLNDHGKARCTFNLRCNVDNCKGAHHPLLHRAEEVVQVAHVECNAHLRSGSVIFRMIPVTLYYGVHAVDCLAFLDEGASATLVENGLTDELNAEGVSEPLVVVWTANMKRHEDHSMRLNLSISSRGSSNKHQLSHVRTVKELVLPRQSIRFDEIAERYEHLRNVPVVDYHGLAPRVLIGLDNLHLFAPLESRVGMPGEPIAVRSILGWTVYGADQQRISAKTFVNYHAIETVSNKELHEMLGTQYALEETCTTTTPTLESDEDRRAREILQQTTVRVGDRFETGLIWKYDRPSFPDSFPMAMNRLKALERRLAKNPELQQNVFRQIIEYQQKGYCHKATDVELAAADFTRVWYLPLNVVLNPKKPGKVRLIWDAAATVSGVSLNSNLLKGPDMLTSLPAVICKFREKAVAFGGDVREMYHQILIRAADKSAQWFLFRLDTNESPDVYVMDVATFGSTCSPCSAQYIKNLNANEFANQFPDASKAIIERHYVDDYFDSVDTEKEAVQRAKEVRFIHSKAGFEIRNWASNSAEVLSHLGESKPNKMIHLNQDKLVDRERVLGVIWNTQEDVLSCSTPPCDELISYGLGHPTKRQVLSTVMSFFDPLGLLAPFTVLGKMLVQDLWRTGCEWDEAIDSQSLDKWKQWMGLLPEIQQVKIPRSYFGKIHSNQFGPIQLHLFCDAGEGAFGCVGLLRIEVDGEARCSLVMARSKVAPLKQLTIPRLELQAAVLAARMSKVIRQNHSLEIQQVFFWTDSQTVLSWIRSDQRKYKQFVGFRIGEILSLSNLSDWRWIPSKLNIADCLTKWGRYPGLHATSPWFRGPDFLYLEPKAWPQQSLPSPNTETEMRAMFLFHDITLVKPFININNISKWNIVVRTVACVFRFISNCRLKIQGRPIETLKPTMSQEAWIGTSIPSVTVPLQQAEFQKAEEVIFKMAQSESFGDDIKILRRNQQLKRKDWIPLEKSSKLYAYTPLIDASGVLRLEGRSADAEHLPFDLRFPIILPRDSVITERLVRSFHERFGHAFRETVKNEIKQRFLIPKLTSLIAKVERGCIWCKIKKNQPSMPRMASLPVQRLTPYQRPFTYVGVDYLGPVEVTVGRRSEKRWIVVFTCMVVRAIHLEVAHSLTAQSCIMAIRRFTCRRGLAMEYFSDNGSNLKAASKEILQQIWKIHNECAHEFTSSKTCWHFNPPSAPHMGGVWERMVRTVKQVMAALDDGRKLSDEILLTTLSEAEDMINSRPLMFVPQSSADVAITPNNFLRGAAPNEPQASIPPTDTALALRDSYQRSQQLANEMWKRWIREYVPTVNRRTKWFGESRPLQKGDLVYVVEGDRRKAWVRGIIEELIVANDGRVRQAMVRTNTGLFKRPTAKLAVLEISSDNPDPMSETGLVLQVGDMLRTAPLGSCKNTNAQAE